MLEQGYWDDGSHIIAIIDECGNIISVMAAVQLELFLTVGEEEEEGRTLADSVRSMLVEDYWLAVGKGRKNTIGCLFFKLCCSHLELSTA